MIDALNIWHFTITPYNYGQLKMKDQPALTLCGLTVNRVANKLAYFGSKPQCSNCQIIYRLAGRPDDARLDYP